MTTLHRRMAPMAAMLAIAAVAIAALVAAPLARATPTPLFATSSQAAVPAGGATGASESATLDSIACAAPGDCVAGGSYRTTSGAEQAMVETESAGTWNAPLRITPPTPTKSQSASIASVSCAAPGDCVAVGSYRGPGSGALVATETNGAWTGASALGAVAGEATDGTALDSVSCPVVGGCVAVGTVTTTKGLIRPAIATESASVWSTPTLPTLPSGDIDTVPTSLSVSCPAAGDCTVAGTDYPASGPELPLLIAQSAGRWSSAETVGPLPGAVADPSQAISIGAIDCPAVGQCTAVGNEETASGASGFALVDAGGSFTVVSLPYPAGSTGLMSGAPGLGIDTVACADAGDCAAGGGFPTAGSEASPAAAPVTAVEDAGTWWAPIAVLAPGDAASATSGVASVRAMSCPAAGQCEGVGAYDADSGQQLPMLVGIVPVLAISSGSLPAARPGVPYSAQLTTSGGSGTASWVVTGGTLPLGLSLNSATGVISGTPRFAQNASFTVTVSDSGPPVQTASASLAITVSTSAPVGPRISRLTASPRRVSADGRRVGRRCAAVTRRDRHHRRCLRTIHVMLRIHLTAAAKVRLTATRLLAGRRVRHGLVLRCVAPRRGNRHAGRCTRPRRVRGHDTFTLPAGTHAHRFLASLDGRALRPGTYRLRLVPTAAGRSGRAATVTVTITG